MRMKMIDPEQRTTLAAAEKTIAHGRTEHAAVLRKIGDTEHYLNQQIGGLVPSNRTFILGEPKSHEQSAWTDIWLCLQHDGSRWHFSIAEGVPGPDSTKVHTEAAVRLTTASAYLVVLYRHIQDYALELMERLADEFQRSAPWKPPTAPSPPPRPQRPSLRLILN